MTTSLYSPVSPRARSGYEDVAAIFLDAGFTPEAVRRGTLAEPRFGYLFSGVADAMDELSRRRPNLRLIPGGAA